MVVNGACKHGDMKHFKEQLDEFKGDVQMEYLESQQLLALQGKGAVAALQVGLRLTEFVRHLSMVDSCSCSLLSMAPRA